MTPAPQEHNAARKVVDVASEDGDRIVISGMAGLYPQARNIKDLENILYNKINPVLSESMRWKKNHPEVARYTGNVPEIECFDAQFFKVHYRQANTMDPLGRKLLEQTYEAIYDAGVNPSQLNGKKVGVFIGTSMSESEKVTFYDSVGKTGFGLTGCSKTMFANRISYWLNAKGPSLNIDASCCSSTSALEQAYQAIARGECESAIVGGANLCLHPQSTVHYGRILALASDGITRSFDQNATGTALSEAINILFLQKAKNAFRIYADVLHVKCEFSFKSHIDDALSRGFCCNSKDNIDFLRAFYTEAGVSPSLVEYVEAFGSANPETDKAELEAFDNIFCKDRTKPLLVGSVMSNIGYSGAATGISAVTKVLLGLHKGELASNLHYETPRGDVAGLCEGRIRIVNDRQRFRCGYAAVNNLSLTGSNGHVLLRGNPKSKDILQYRTDLPRLVNISGRQESAVTKIFDELKSHQIDPEQLALLYNIHETKIAGHLGRGYIILDNNNHDRSMPTSSSEKVAYFDDTRRPLWFVYSGMGSQWAGMGVQLMRIPIFAAAIERCRRVLEPKGIDIVHIICSSDKTIFDNILHSFVGIAAVQIGLTDVLNALGLVPDNIIGHSVGELGCAYADGCFTAEEMILSAYSRGLVSSETEFIRGSMAAVGAGYDQILKICPPEIEIACHNGPDSCTISGPVEEMRVFIKALTDKGIFAKEVPCSNIAFHSRYIAKAGPGLLKYLKDIIKSPKPRSQRWISTSVPQDRWEEANAKLCSAEYHTNNLLSAVLFDESSKLIPSNAVLVEVAPHGLLQAILKRSLPDSCTNIPLTRRGHPDNVLLLLEAIGKLYIEGYESKIRLLYPKVTFPVSSGTPYLSHFVEWVHDEKWSLSSFCSVEKKVAASSEYLISIYDDEYSYLKGHVIGDKTLLPFSFALVAAWDTLSMSVNFKKKEMDVEFHDVQFYSQPILFSHRNKKLSVSLHKGSGRFEIMDENSKVATGYIEHSKEKNTKGLTEAFKSYYDEFLEMTSEDVYQLLNERNYSYKEEFQSLMSADVTMNKAIIKWNKNWVTLIDGMIQLNEFKHHHTSVSQPDQIGRMTINVKEHIKSIVNRKDGTSVISACVDDLQHYTRCGGIVIENMKFIHRPSLNKDNITLKSLKFLPRFHSNIDLFSSIQVIMQIVAENTNKNIVNVIGITHKNSERSQGVFTEIKKLIDDQDIHGAQIQYRQIDKDTKESLSDADLVVVPNVLHDDKTYQMLHRTLERDTFILNEESLEDESHTRHSAHYSILSVMKCKDRNTRLELARWRATYKTTSERITTLTIYSQSEIPLLFSARKSLSPEGRLVILTSYPPVKGVKDIVMEWKKTTAQIRVCLVMAERIDILEQLPHDDLTFNVLNMDGEWGGEYYLPSIENDTKQNKIELQCEQIGNFDSLKWVNVLENMSNGKLVKVCYAGIHVNDVKRAAGVISSANTECSSGNGFGLEFSGLTESGEKVMGLVPHGAVSSHVMARPELLWPVPSHWTLEDAATVPFAYAYAYYCLNVKVAIRLVEKHVTQFRVLVHGAAGALGQAMISISLAKGYKVFATVSDRQKKQFLLRMFPELQEEHIGNSRDATFGDMIKKVTHGEGCNIVLCCLRGELKNASLNCCSSSGTTFDTILINNRENYTFGMHYLTIERSYMPVDISSIFSHLKQKDLMALQTMISDGIALGHVRPLSRVTFAPHEAPRAFRLLAASRHRGRVLLRMQDSQLLAQPILTSAQDRCLLILSDERHLGLQLADMLMHRGANKIHIHVNKLPSHLPYRLSLWKKLKVQVTVSSGHLMTDNDIANLLHKAIKTGPLEGVYVIADNSIKRNVISCLDLETRKLCLSLKNFVVLSENGISGKKTCTVRYRNGLPATMLDLSLLKTFYNNIWTWHRKAVDATVLALRSADPILLAHPHHLPELTLLQQITHLTDVKITDKTSENVSLEELGIDSEKSQTVSALLANKYHISLFDETIPALTIQQINQMEEVVMTKLEKVEGLRKFYLYVDPDELLATTEMVFLPTLTNSFDTRDDDHDISDSFLYIIPGMEGHHARFRTLCERLKLPAFVLQPGLDYPEETPQELAQRYAEILMKKTELKERFNLLGYETGVMVALELAAILEKRGKTGTVFCIGDGPEETKAILEVEVAAFGSEKALQEGVVRHMSALMGHVSVSPAEVGWSSWSARVEACVRSLLGRVPHSAQYARALLEAAYARIGTARRYSADPRPLRSRLVLLRANTAPYSGDCSLQRYSTQAIVVANLAAPLSHAAYDLRAPALLNRYLDEEILNAFENKNLCQSYILNMEKLIQAQA